MVTSDQIKDLRDKTGISVMQCKKALEDAGGDMNKAIELLKKKSGEIAVKKSERTLGAGVVASYVHSSSKVGALVELNCETDFVAKNQEFKDLAYEIAMHVTASNPKYVKIEDVTEDVKQKAAGLFKDEVDASGKPEDIKAKMLEGKISAYLNERVLLNQPFIKNPDETVGDLVKKAIQKFGEKIEVAKFNRIAVLED